MIFKLYAAKVIAILLYIAGALWLAAALLSLFSGNFAWLALFQAFSLFFGGLVVDIVADIAEKVIEIQEDQQQIAAYLRRLGSEKTTL